MYRQIRRVLTFAICCILFLCNSALAQKEIGIDQDRKQEIRNSINELDKAMVSADTFMLSELLDEKVSFRHSNGMTESKQELLDNLKKGYLRYTSIEQLGDAEITKWEGKKGGYWKDHTVKRKLHVTGELEGTRFDVHLSTKEHWILVDNKWKLVERESMKLDK